MDLIILSTIGAVVVITLVSVAVDVDEFAAKTFTWLGLK